MERAIIGNGGFVREVKSQMNNYEILCFVDDEYFLGEKFTDKLSNFNPNKYEVIVAIGNPQQRYNIIQRLPQNTKYFSFIHQTAIIIGKDCIIGEGSIICAGSILTTNITLGKHSQINLQSTIGHDCIVGDYFTTAPGTKISGNCNIGDRVYFGTNSCTKEKTNICDDVIIGLNSGVVKNINLEGTYIGTPCIKIK